jgi:hypothetical protein
LTQAHEDLRRGVREVCSCFPNEYWRDLDERRRYPEEFVEAMTEAGYLGALIPEEYGGMGLDLAAGCAILEEVNRSGANAGHAHAQMYTMGPLLRHGSEEQKGEYLPKIARGDLRLQAFAVTEPEAGTDTTFIKTMATREPLPGHPHLDEPHPLLRRRARARPPEILLRIDVYVRRMGVGSIGKPGGPQSEISLCIPLLSRRVACIETVSQFGSLCKTPTRVRRVPSRGPGGRRRCGGRT